MSTNLNNTNIVKKTLLLVLFCLLSSCKGEKVEVPILLKDNLYEMKDGRLFYGTSALSSISNRLSTGNILGETHGSWVTVYRSYLGFEEDNSLIKLNTVVDADSWHQIAQNMYADKSRVYYFSAVSLSSGGSLLIVPMLKPEKLTFYNVRTLRDLWDFPQLYFKGENYVYYKGMKLIKADVETFSVIKQVEGHADGGYAVDKNQFYEGKKVLTKKQFFDKLENMESEQSYYNEMQLLLTLFDSLNN